MCFCVKADALCIYTLTESHSYSQCLTDGADFNDQDMCIFLHAGQIHSTGKAYGRKNVYKLPLTEFSPDNCYKQYNLNFHMKFCKCGENLTKKCVSLWHDTGTCLNLNPLTWKIW